MRKVAVFGNTGGGKSTLARRLAEVTGLPLYPLDRIEYKAGGEETPHEEYLEIHSDLLSRDEWIIDGFGGLASAWERFSGADTLVTLTCPFSRISGGSRSALPRACSSVRRAGQRRVPCGAAR